MRNLIKKLGLIFVLLIAVIALIGLLMLNNQNKNTSVFPIKKEIGNYIIDIEYTKMFQDSLITKYYITTKDGTNINNSNISVVINDINGIIDYGIFPSTILCENIDNNKLVIVEEFFIAAKNSNTMELKYEFSGNDINNIPNQEKKIKGSYYLNESNENYEYIHKQFSLDGISFTVESIANLDFGSIIHFYTNDTNLKDVDDKYDYILDNYHLKLKSGEYVKTYKIKSLIEYTNPNIIKNLVSIGNYDKDIQYISFFQGNIIYNNNEVNTKNMEIYLVNNTTGQEALIYSNLNK